MKTSSEVQFPMERQILEIEEANKRAFEALKSEYDNYKESVKNQAIKLSNMINETKRKILKTQVLSTVFPIPEQEEGISFGSEIKVGVKDDVLTLTPRLSAYPSQDISLKFEGIALEPVFEHGNSTSGFASSTNTKLSILGVELENPITISNIKSEIEKLQKLQQTIEFVSQEFPATYQQVLEQAMKKQQSEARKLADLSSMIKDSMNPLRQFERDEPQIPMPVPEPDFPQLPTDIFEEDYEGPKTPDPEEYEELPPAFD